MRLVDTIYIQKSKIFLLPLLNIRRDPNIMPVCSYIIDKQKDIDESNSKLILPFLKDDSSEYLYYEKELLDNPHFDIDLYYETPKHRVYIYDLEAFSEDFSLFLHGKYSEFSKRSKTLINIYWGKRKGSQFIPHSKVEAYLDPKMHHYSQVARDLNVSVDDLIKVKELISPPDLEKETFYNYNKTTIGNKISES